MNDIYKDIRPFYDEEVPSVLKEVVEDPEFAILENYLQPGKTHQQISEEICSYQTNREFQIGFAYPAIKLVLQKSVDSWAHNGLRELSKDDTFLFMSNHRDIVLDPALINVCLFEEGYKLSQMAIGKNLLISPMVTKLFGLINSFVVQRNESPRQLYEAWKKLSAYIYHVINDRKQSLWIAQREGRAKDGDDRTQTGILKMFLMNFGGDFINTIRKLNIVPVSVSYEFDPCDYLKAVELFSVQNELPFVKDSEHNLRSMLTGLQGNKGRIQVSFGRPLNDFLDLYPGMVNQNDWIKWLTNLIDTEIHRNYHLWPSNYLAYDLLFGSDKFIRKYSPEEKEYFIKRLDKQLEQSSGGDKELLRSLMLTNYANCVINKIKALARED